MKYPDYVKEYRPKGTVVKKVGEIYYAYYATSKREPGKKYPVQVIKGLAGRIDRSGFHEQTRMVLETKSVKVRESGFTNYMLMFEEEYVTHGIGTVRITPKTKRDIYHSLIVYLSNNSYLGDTGTIYSTEEMSEKYGIGLPRQLTMISKIIERPLSELEPLKYICSVEIGGKWLESELTEAQKSIMGRLGIDEKDIRRRIK
jgi:hypothetical protein